VNTDISEESYYVHVLVEVVVIDHAELRELLGLHLVLIKQVLVQILNQV
jgi:hypothetical protein